MAEIMVYVSERLNGPSVEADFCHGENIDHAEKKAQNSDFHWGPVHGGIATLEQVNRQIERMRRHCNCKIIVHSIFNTLLHIKTLFFTFKHCFYLVWMLEGSNIL